MSASPGGPCILGGFALLLLVFRVDDELKSHLFSVHFSD